MRTVLTRLYKWVSVLGIARDAARDSYLSGLGLEVIRFSNLEVLHNIDGVLAVIVERLERVKERYETKTP